MQIGHAQDTAAQRYVTYAHARRYVTLCYAHAPCRRSVRILGNACAYGRRPSAALPGMGPGSRLAL